MGAMYAFNSDKQFIFNKLFKFYYLHSIYRYLDHTVWQQITTVKEIFVKYLVMKQGRSDFINISDLSIVF